MGVCKYCGEKAGFLKKSHRECAEKRSEGKKMILGSLVSSIIEETDFSAARKNVEEIAKESFIRPYEISQFIRRAAGYTIERFLDDGHLSEDEEDKICKYMEHFTLDQNNLPEYDKLVKGAILREIMEGVISTRANIIGSPFNLMKSEQLVYAFNNVDYYEQKTRREYVGGSKGVSVRVAKGVYFRASSFRGRPVERTETVHADTGVLGVTNKHLYFQGAQKSFRIRFDKIVTFEPYSDGIGVQRDAASAKPQTFVTGDGWFIYNLVVNLARV